MKGRQINYTLAEVSFLAENKAEPRKKLAAMFNEKFNRNISVNNIKAKCTRMGLKTGRTGCFEKGHISHNKGRKGWSPKGSEKGWFKKGRLPHNTKYLGHERVCSKDGYIYISVDIPCKHTGFERSYVLKHRYLWEKENGPVPKGHFLKSLDGNRKNTEPSNWECLPNSMKPRLVAGYAGQDYDGAPNALKPSIMLTAKVSDRISQIRKSA